MKKIILKKKETSAPQKRIGYKIDYLNELNSAQHEAVMHNNGAALVIAGAGTGKTRTLIYRLARLVEDGVPPDTILLLTFTRKSASEMLRRASMMLDGRCERVSGGTFHSFALSVLRRYATNIGYTGNFTILDQGDSYDTINIIRSSLKLDKSKRRFPKKDTLGKIFNLAINRCCGIEDVVVDEYPHFMDDIDQITAIFNNYNSYKRQYNLMDYDDMLLNLLSLMKSNPLTEQELQKKIKYMMVDEYQDTNLLQHEIVLRLAGKHKNIMAVGDDAQSIYSFRGANFQNIIKFPESFDDCKIFKIEENYRSSQQILDVTNAVIADAAYKYEKELFTRKVHGEKPIVVSASNERQQSEFVVQQILELLEQDISLEDIAVMARSGFLMFDLEIELAKANIPYKKFGGMKFVETAHIKDLLAYFKIMYNPLDAVSWYRVLMLIDGVGPRTAQKIIDSISAGNIVLDRHSQVKISGSSGEAVQELIGLLSDLRSIKIPVAEKAPILAEYYKPIMERKYDDWKKRRKDIEMFLMISEKYSNMNDFLNDMSIEPPVESVIDIEEETKEDEFLTLTTVHSAKGLEWRAVFIIWALDGRFPSTRSSDILESLEEERRLFYVACSRAKENLYISYPINIFDRESGVILSKPTRFLDSISEELADRFIIEETFTDEELQ